MSRIAETSELKTACMAVTYKFVEPEPEKADKNKKRTRRNKKK
jgi:hypothetical protein